MAIIIIIVISLCPFPLAYDVFWSFIFPLYVPTYNLSQILQILVPGIDNYPVCDIKSVSKMLSQSWALFFFTICRELPQATSHFIFKLCSYSRNTSVTDEKKKTKRKKQVSQMMKPQCREDLSRNLLKVCWHLFACFPPCLMDHHNVTLVSFFFINISFSLCVKWGGCTRGTFSVYATCKDLWTHTIGSSELRTCGQFTKDIVVKGSPDERKVRTRCS